MSNETGYRNPRYTDLENEALRERNRELKEATARLCDTIEAYTRQGVLRSSLLAVVRDTRAVLTGGGQKTPSHNHQQTASKQVNQ